MNTTAEVVLNTAADAPFLLQWMGVVIAAIFLMKLVAPFLPVIGPWLETVSKTTSTLEKAVPALKQRSWWVKGISVLDFMKMIAGFVQVAEVDKSADPTGEKRLQEVKTTIRRVMGVKHEWSKEQEAAVEDMIKATLAQEGLIGKLASGVPAPFRGNTNTPAVS